jgi:arylsulfatase A-like enzyme
VPKIFTIGLAGLVAWGALAFVGCHPAAKRTRVVLITLDTLRYDGVFPSGSESDAMPALHKRAQGGAWFARFYATTTVTQPTHASLFTSLPPWEHGVTRNGQILAADHVTLAERLHDAGYQTAAVVASFPLSERFGFRQGFDRFSEEFTRGELDQWRSWEVPEKKFFTLADRVTDRAIEQISSATGDRQFFWFHYFDAHAPYGDTAGESFSKVGIFAALESGAATQQQLLDRARRLYRLDLAYLDAALERLLARLDADASEFETHIFVTSDHGESLGELGSVGHGDRLSDAEIHIPAFLISPKVAPGLRNDVAGVVDVEPTLLSVAGLGSLATGLSGRDLSKPDERSPGVWGMRRTGARSELGEKRLDGRIYALPMFWFYAVDPEGHVYRGNAGHILPSGGGQGSYQAEQLEARFGRFEARIEGQPSDHEMDKETREGLEALGYLE